MSETKKKGYKDTLNLPKTSFSMKANLPQREPEFIKRWAKEDIYARILAARESSGKSFILHDGPPYANGHIHMGHVLNKILKDICVKYYAMNGYRAPYVPGWDCHGLPVEHALLKEMKISKHEIDQVEFRKAAYKYAMKFVRIQAKEFKRLGIFGDWEDPYLTLTKDYEADILEALAELYEKGYVYKDLKPVNWCSSCETALAEAEVEYGDKVSPSIFVKFRAKGEKDIYYVIWTTTPWTLPANVAVAVHPEFVYAVVDTGKEKLILAKDLVPALAEKFGLEDHTVTEELTGRQLSARWPEAVHPFIGRESAIVMADYVTKDEGTGCVHTAPGHGQDDYFTGKKYDLPIIMPVDNSGKFNDDIDWLSGQFVLKANKTIIERMKADGTLIFTEDMNHSYPHCWRCKEPIIFRATEQWFMNVDHNGLRGRISEKIEDSVEWIPPSGKDRIGAMVKQRPDWCLSRQRYWGVPIPAFQCASCGETFTDADIIKNVAALTRKETSNVWFQKEAADLMPGNCECPACGSSELIKENNILDVWFDSGVSHRAVIDARRELSYPADLYLEGSDQHRGWFQSALITAMATKEKPPYRKVLTHGFVVDGEGKKMSKSVGNVISPEEVMRKYGADILRLWVSSSDYEGDIKLSEEILERLADGYRKIRNTLRYLISNLYDFDPENDCVDGKELPELERWMLSRLSGLLRDVNGYYSKWEFHRVYRAVYNFCVYEVSSFYLDAAKDILYILSPCSPERKAAQTVIFRILDTLVRVMAPVLAFTAEEAWEHVPGRKKEQSVHMADWPDRGEADAWADPELDRRWKEILRLRESVMKVLEVKREEGLIGSSLEAALTLYSDDDGMRDFLESNSGLFPYLFKVSAADVLESPGKEMEKVAALPIMIGVSRSPGEKCPRCWNYSETVGKSKRHPELCRRCDNVIAERSDNG
ncbi:MAG: isoleucine--tRNA ligase [Candidatus Omnitrophica bacterium]|nr:isoleucine--tRNA ligase [Candidatus Omnitrophota bacterium]